MEYTIEIRLSPFAPTVKMIVTVPERYDPEEYIDDLLGGIFVEEVIYNCEWDFV